MLFPLLSPSGEVGYECDNSYRSPLRGDSDRVSMAKFYMYCIAHRGGQIQFQCGGKLFQQYIVMAYIKVEDARLHCIMNHQRALCSESYSGFQDYVRRSVQTADMRVGKIVVLPSTSRESPRFRYQKYMDALAGMRGFGSYDLCHLHLQPMMA